MNLRNPRIFSVHSGAPSGRMTLTFLERVSERQSRRSLQEVVADEHFRRSEGHDDPKHNKGNYLPPIG